MKLKEIPENTVVHTPTEEEAHELLAILHENGYSVTTTIREMKMVNSYKDEDICFSIDDKKWGHCTRKWYEKKGYTILTLAEFKERYLIPSNLGELESQPTEKEPQPKFYLGERIRIVSSGEEDYINMITQDDCYELLEHRGKYVESELAPYTEPKTQENRNLSQDVANCDNPEDKELNLVELLRGHEGETFYSTISGDVKIKDFCDGVMKPIGTTSGRYCSDGKYQGGGVVCLYPSRALYEQYPLDAYAAWKEWKEGQKKFGLDIKIETYFEGKGGWEDCDDDVSCLHFRTPADRDKCIEEIQAVIEKYSEK